MKRFCLTPALLILIASAFAGDLRHDWAQKYNAISKIFSDRNVQGIQQMLADKFVLIDEKGVRHSRADAIKHEYEPLGMANYAHFEANVPSVRKRGSDVDVSYDVKYYVVYDDPKYGHYKVHGEELGVDTWHKFGNTWLVVQTRVTKAKESKVSGR